MMLTFTNRHGATMQVDDNLTLEDLLRMGATVKLAKRAEPMEDDWWQYQPGQPAALQSDEQKI